MPQVRFNGPLRINLTGYDREAVTLEAGVHDVPERIAEWVRRNPSAGEVVEEPAEPGGAVVSSRPSPVERVELLASLTVAELRQRAARWGVEGSGSMKKADLVAALDGVGRA